MPVAAVIVALVVIGLALFVLSKLEGIDPSIMALIRMVLIVVAVIVVLIWLLGAFHVPVPEGVRNLAR